MAFTGNSINIEFTLTDNTGNTSPVYQSIKELEPIDMPDQISLIKDVAKGILTSSANTIVSVAWTYSCGQCETNGLLERGGE